jgi:hypothetical protein
MTSTPSRRARRTTDCALIPLSTVRTVPRKENWWTAGALSHSRRPDVANKHAIIVFSGERTHWQYGRTSSAAPDWHQAPIPKRRKQRSFASIDSTCCAENWSGITSISSGRSVPGFDLEHQLQNFAPLLDRFGGAALGSSCQQAFNK